MASTLEEANDYVVLNMEGLEGEDNDTNIITINPERGQGDGQRDVGENADGKHAVGGGADEEHASEVTQSSERSSVTQEVPGDKRCENNREESQDIPENTDVTEKEKEQDTEMPSGENAEVPPSDNTENEAPSGSATGDDTQDDTHDSMNQQHPDDADDQSDDDGVQPLVLGGYDDPDSPGGCQNDDSQPPGSTGDFAILDFSDMDQLDLTGGASSTDMRDLSESFRPQIISVQSGHQVDFGFGANKDSRDVGGDVAMETNKDRESEKEKDGDEKSQDATMVVDDEGVKDGSESVTSSRDVGSEKKSYRRNRGSQDSHMSNANSDPVIILSDEEEEEVQHDDKSDEVSEKDDTQGSQTSETRDTSSRDTATEFAELQAAILSFDDPLVRKIAKREKLNIDEAKQLAEEVRKYRTENDIEINDSPIETDEDSPDAAIQTSETFHPAPLNIISETTKGLHVRMKGNPGKTGRKSQFSGRDSPEPVMTFPAPEEQEPDEITGDELKFYKNMIQNPKPTQKTRTIRELLYHREQGKLPPGNYFTFDDCLIREDETRIKIEKEEERARVLNVTTKMIDLKKEDDDRKDIIIKESPKYKAKTEMTQIKEKPKITIKTTTVSQASRPVQNTPLISLSKTNNQEMPPEGGSTIILPDGTTIKMSAQQAFNITSTINVPGSGGDENYGQEEGECYEVGEEDDLWATHMTCEECGELLPLEEVMKHMVSQHWENNPSCYKCGTCDAWFFNKVDYHTHLSRVVEKSGDFIKMDKLYKCAVCNKYFKDSEFFLKHLHRKHTDVEALGSMKLLTEIQERQQIAATSSADVKPVTRKPTPPPIRVASPIVTKQQTITKKTKISRPATKVITQAQVYRGKTTSMVRDISVRLGVKNKFQQLASKTPDKKDLREGTIITAPSSDSSEEEIPGDEAATAKIKEEVVEDSKRWAVYSQAALSTGPPPKTIVPQLSGSPVPSDASSSHPGSGTNSPHPTATTRAATTTTVLPLLAPKPAAVSLASSISSSLTPIAPQSTPGGVNVQARIQGLQGAPIIPASALRPFLSQARPGSNVVLMMPNSFGGGAPRIVATTTGSLPIRVPGMDVLSGLRQATASTIQTVSSNWNRGILSSTASKLEQRLAVRGQRFVSQSQEPLRKVPLILQKRNSGRKVNPLLNRSSIVINRIDSSGSLSMLQQGAQAGMSKGDTPIVNVEGFDIPQFIEYNPPPTPTKMAPRKRGRRPNPNREQRRRGKRKKRGRPRASSEDGDDSDDEEFDNWLEQVSEKADKKESGHRRKVLIRRESTDSTDDDDTENTESQDGSEINYPIEQGKSMKRFTCNLCSKKFLYSSSLLAHMKTEHTEELRDTIDGAGDVMLKCQVCDHCFDTEEQLNFHSLTHMDDDDGGAEAQESSGEFECQYCGEKFEIEDHLNYHIIKHQIAMEEGEEASDEDMNVEGE